jgi:hypothetical protein
MGLEQRAFNLREKFLQMNEPSCGTVAVHRATRMHSCGSPVSNSKGAGASKNRRRPAGEGSEGALTPFLGAVIFLDRRIKEAVAFDLKTWRIHDMEFTEKAKIRLEHWIDHNEHHQEEYELFGEQLEDAGKIESARAIREMVDLTAKSTAMLKKALEHL